MHSSLKQKVMLFLIAGLAYYDKKQHRQQHREKRSRTKCSEVFEVNEKKELAKVNSIKELAKINGIKELSIKEFSVQNYITRLNRSHAIKRRLINKLLNEHPDETLYDQLVNNKSKSIRVIAKRAISNKKDKPDYKQISVNYDKTSWRNPPDEDFSNVELMLKMLRTIKIDSGILTMRKPLKDSTTPMPSSFSKAAPVKNIHMKKNTKPIHHNGMKIYQPSDPPQKHFIKEGHSMKPSDNIALTNKSLLDFCYNYNCYGLWAEIDT